jgi:hypothetical protein
VSKELLALVEGSSSSDPDTLANAYLELADSYILARKEETAIEYFLRANEISPLSLSADPRPILARGIIHGSQVQRTKIYQFEKDRFNRRRLIPSTYEDILEDPSVEPQWFIVDWEGAHQGFVVPDRNSNLSQRREIQELVGNPILFSKDQLTTVIPFRRGKNMEKLKIILSFTVTSRGDLEEIEIKSSTAPAKLNRLVVDSLKKAHYRPGLANGLPVTTKNVILEQTFPSH